MHLRHARRVGLGSLTFVLLACGGAESPPPVAPPPAPTAAATPTPVAATPPKTAVPPAKADPSLLPRSLFFANADHSRAQISPDGKHLLWLAPVDGVTNVWV